MSNHTHRANVGQSHTAGSVSFAEFVSRSSVDRLRSWLLMSFTNDRFDPIQVTDEPSVPVQFQYELELLQPELQERFKDATIMAAAEWKLAFHGPNALMQLAYLAVNIRATGIIPILREVIRSEELDNLKFIDSTDGDDLYTDTVEFLVAVLQGFAPLDEVKEFFERLYFDDRFDVRFAAQLFLGLCTCEPDNYVSYVPRFLALAERYPDYYSMKHIINGFEEIVTLSRIAKYLHHLDRVNQEQLLVWLCAYDWSPADIESPDLGIGGFVLTSRHEMPVYQDFPLEGDEDMFSNVMYQAAANMGSVKYAFG